MGTSCDIIISEIDTAEGEKVSEEIVTEIRRIESRLSRFTGTSEISFINTFASKYPVQLDDEMFSILEQVNSYNKRTFGSFDITMRAVNEFRKGDPGNKKIEEISASVGWDKVDMNFKTRTIFLPNKILELDLGGFGKGYALEQVMPLIKKFSLENIFISLGESSVLALGNHPHGTGWKVGIRHSINPAILVKEFLLNNQSLSSSGNIYFNPQEKNLPGNSINPDILEPVNEKQTVTVIADSPLEAEVLSTALLVSDTEKRNKIRRNFNNILAYLISYNIDQSATISEI
ncbi:MAG: FAD:protein FMN transferase [Bacteroidales bacterium]|nr:FAD:protein FMN transferase [Bacteroidales bacterium]